MVKKKKEKKKEGGGGELKSLLLGTSVLYKSYPGPKQCSLASVFTQMVC